MERPAYPSDITRAQFATLEPVLESARQKTRPRTIDLYDIFCGVAYVLKSGCQWRMLPRDFPKWQTCYAYWRKWTEEREGLPTILEESLKKCGWRGPTKPWEMPKHNLSDR